MGCKLRNWPKLEQVAQLVCCLRRQRRQPKAAQQRGSPRVLPRHRLAAYLVSKVAFVSLFCARPAALPCKPLGCGPRFSQKVGPVATEQSANPFADPPAQVHALLFNSVVAVGGWNALRGKEKQAFPKKQEFPSAVVSQAHRLCRENGVTESFGCVSCRCSSAARRRA